MTKERFIKELRVHGYRYNIQGDKIIVTHTGSHVNLNHLTSIPPNVVFNNEMDVDLESIKDIPSGVEFNNRSSLYLSSVTSISPDVVFHNEWGVDLKSLEEIPRSIVFNNRGWVDLTYLLGGLDYEWKGTIQGISIRRLLNKMISIGLFER
jgi:hypothetical protein